ncbi:MAG TPA: peptidylprolyl isomerase [Acidiferrobacterales bacterium]|nr:peptidylprolyl isomerase [Acidiferrobacterales bacterium]
MTTRRPLFLGHRSRRGPTSSIHGVVILLLSAGLVLGACSKKSPDDSKVLASVNGETITEKDYEDYLRARQAQQPPIPDKEKEKKVVLDEMVNRVLLVHSAVDQKVDQELDVYFQIKRQRENVLARAMLRKYLKDNPISDEEVQKRFEQEMEKADKNEYRARHILVRTEEEAKEIIAELKKGTNFNTLAQKKSIDVRSGKQGGDLGWFSQDVIVPEFFNAVTTMKKGEISQAPVKSDFGWHVIKFEDSRPRKLPTFDQAKGNIRQIVQQERVDALVKSLKDKGKVKINE